MVNTLPAVSTQGESIADVLVEHRDILARVDTTLERSFSKLDVIEDVMKSTLSVQEAQANALRLQTENAEFASAEAAREAARRAQADRQADIQATAEPVGSAGGGLSSFASGLAGGLAAGGVGSTLRLLAGRLITGGGLAAVGMYFGEEIGKFLSTEADAFLNDTGISDQIRDNITTALRENTDEALIFGGISRLIFGRTLPGIIAGFVLGGLDIEKLFSDDPEVRREFYDNLGNELSSGWDALVENRQLASIVTGAGILALLTRGPLIKRIAVSLIGAYGLSNLLPGDEDIDNFNEQLENQVIQELTLLGFDPETAGTAVDVGSAAVSGLTASWLAGLINKRLKIPALIAGFIWSYFDLSRIFTPEGRDELLNNTEGEVRRLLEGEGATEDYIDATIAALGIGYAARQGARILRPSPTFTPQGTVQGPGQAARPGARPPLTPGTFVRPRRPNGQFMSDAEIQDMYEQQIRDARYKRVFRNVIRGLAVLGIVLTAVEAYELYNILNSSASEDVKRAAVGAFIGGFVGAMGGAAAGASIGLYFGPWGALIVGALGAGAGGFAGGFIGEYIAGWAFDDEPPAYQTQEQYESFIQQNRERFEAGPNAMIIPGIAADNTGAIQRTTPSFGQQFGFRPSAPQAGTGATAEPVSPEEIEVTPEQRAIVDQITGLMTDLEGLRAEEEVAREQYENRRGRDRRSAELRVENLATQIENLEEEIENLRTLLDRGATRPSDVSMNTGTGEARIYNAALGTSMTVGSPRPMQAAFTPSFGEPRVIRASLSPDTPTASADSMTEDQRKALMVYSAFTQAGFSDSQARALVGEVYRENGFREQYWYGTHTDPANEATNAGIISWQGPRKADLYNYLGDRGLLNADGSMKPGFDTLVAQAEYLRYEMQTGAGGGTPGQISRYQDWFRSDQVSAEESARVLGQDFIRWRMTDPVYRPGGMANIEYGRSQIDSVLSQSPDTRRVDTQPVAPGGDMEANQSMFGSFAESFQNLIKNTEGFGFDATFGAGTFANILRSDNPEEFIASKLEGVFNRGGVGVTPAAVELSRGSERATTAPIVINAPVVNNDNSVQAGGGSSGRVVASNERAISTITDRSLASTVSEWWDATMA